MKQVAAVFDVPLMAIVFVGILSKRTPAIAAWAAVAVGVTFFSIVSFVLNNRIAGHDIHWLPVAGMNFALMMGVMALFRFLAPRKIPFEHTYTEDVEIDPWPVAKPLGIVIVISVFGVYALLAFASG